MSKDTISNPVNSEALSDHENFKSRRHAMLQFLFFHAELPAIPTMRPIRHREETLTPYSSQLLSEVRNTSRVPINRPIDCKKKAHVIDYGMSRGDANP